MVLSHDDKLKFSRKFSAITVRCFFITPSHDNKSQRQDVYLVYGDSKPRNETAISLEKQRKTRKTGKNSFCFYSIFSCFPLFFDVYAL